MKVDIRQIVLLLVSLLNPKKGFLTAVYGVEQFVIVKRRAEFCSTSGDFNNSR